VISLLLVGGAAAADPIVGHRHLVNILDVAAEVLERGAANLAEGHAHLLRVVREVLLPVPAAALRSRGARLLKIGNMIAGIFFNKMRNEE
jgi:hypothetical protein